MSYSHTTTASKTYTLSNAKYVASKVRTDLRQFQRWYGDPSDAEIDAYHDELVILSADAYVDQVKYGFKRGGIWVLTLEYRFRYDGTLVGDDRAGGVRHPFNPNGASFTSYLYWSPGWRELTPTEQDAVRKTLPIARTPTGEPQYAPGRYASDRTYAVDGSGASRRMYIPA
jgi:Bacterial HORMA domain family 1